MKIALNLSQTLSGKIISEIESLLNDGPGYVLVSDTGLENLNHNARNKLLIDFAEKFGRPTQHSNSNDYIWSVSPLRDAHEYDEPLPSERAGACAYHTDSCFALVPEKYFILYTIRASNDGGGDSLIIDAQKLIEKISSCEYSREYMKILYKEKFPFVAPLSFSNVNKIITEPILSKEPLIRFRYKIIKNGFNLRPYRSQDDV